MIICFNNKIPMDNKCVEENFYSLTKSGLAPNQLLYIFRNILKPNDWPKFLSNGRLIQVFPTNNYMS